MDINNLKAFIEVADKKSFSRSAETLKLTQPAVSKRIAVLESELSARLFDRVGRNVQLTEAGRMLLPSAMQINRELLRIEEVICNLDKAVSGTLSISCCEYVGCHYLPDVLTDFRQDYPDVDIDLHLVNSRDTSHDLVKEVEDGQVELALCSYPSDPSPSAKLQALEIWSDSIVLVVANTHPLVRSVTARGGQISLAELCAVDSILPPPNTSVRRELDKYLQAGNQTATVCVEANDFETIKQMTAIGLGWACLPTTLVDHSLTVLPTEKLEIYYSVALLMSRDHTLSRAAEAFIASLPIGQHPRRS